MQLSGKQLLSIEKPVPQGIADTLPASDVEMLAALLQWSPSSTAELQGQSPWANDDEHRLWLAYLNKRERSRLAKKAGLLDVSHLAWGLPQGKPGRKSPSKKTAQNGAVTIALNAQVKAAPQNHKTTSANGAGHAKNGKSAQSLRGGLVGLPAGLEGQPEFKLLRDVYELFAGSPREESGSPRETWWSAWQGLVQWALCAPSAAAPSTEETPLAWQLRAVELPLALAVLFPELQATDGLLAAATDRLQQSLALFHGGGHLLPNGLQTYRALLASWTRCQQWLRLADRPLAAASTVAYQQAWRLAWRLTFGNAVSQLTSNGYTSAQVPPNVFERDLPWESAFVQAAKALLVRKDDALLPAVALQEPSENRVQAVSSLSPAYYDEDAKLAVLRCRWQSDSPAVVVAFDGEWPLVEVFSRGTAFFRGEWSSAGTMNGLPLPKLREWREVCWVSDEDVDFLEIEAKSDAGLCVQRQFLLARSSGLLLMTQVLLSEEPTTWAAESRLKIAGAAAMKAETKTREAWLTSGRQQALVLPVALGEWRTDGLPGGLSAQGGDCVLTQMQQGNALYMPLVFDLSHQSRAGNYTWRSLTVADNRVRQRADVAVGYRIQLDRQQYLLYRSLAKPCPRTLLGHHLGREFLFGRFTAEGTVQPLLEVL